MPTPCGTTGNQTYVTAGCDDCQGENCPELTAADILAGATLNDCAINLGITESMTQAQINAVLMQYICLLKNNGVVTSQIDVSSCTGGTPDYKNIYIRRNGVLMEPMIATTKTRAQLLAYLRSGYGFFEDNGGYFIKIDTVPWTVTFTCT